MVNHEDRAWILDALSEVRGDIRQFGSTIERCREVHDERIGKLERQLATVTVRLALTTFFVWIAAAALWKLGIEKLLGG